MIFLVTLYLSRIILHNYCNLVNSHSDHSLRRNSLSNQSLVFQSSISSNDAAINKYSIFPPNETVSTITNAGADSLGNNYIFIPAIMTSLDRTLMCPHPHYQVFARFFRRHIFDLQYSFAASLCHYSSTQF